MELIQNTTTFLNNKNTRAICRGVVTVETIGETTTNQFGRGRRIVVKSSYFYGGDTKSYILTLFANENLADAFDHVKVGDAISIFGTYNIQEYAEANKKQTNITVKLERLGVSCDTSRGLVFEICGHMVDVASTRSVVLPNGEKQESYSFKLGFSDYSNNRAYAYFNGDKIAIPNRAVDITKLNKGSFIALEALPRVTKSERAGLTYYNLSFVIYKINFVANKIPVAVETVQPIIKPEIPQLDINPFDNLTDNIFDGLEY